MLDKAGRAASRMQLHHDRMPILLKNGEVCAWLDGSMGADDLKPAPEKALREWVVSPRVNRTEAGDDDPSLTEAVEA